jgi:hypothetical protein
VSALQQCAPRNCHPRRTPLTIAGFIRGTGTLKDSERLAGPGAGPDRAGADYD